MYESRVFPRTDLREHSRRFAIERERFLPVRLATIDIGLRRRIDQRIELQPAEGRTQLIRLSQIKLRVVEPDNVEFVPPFADECCAQPAAGADDDQSLHSIGT